MGIDIDKLVLTEEETKLRLKEAGYIGFLTQPIMDSSFAVIAKAQLDKAEPLIRKDERERIFNWMSEPCPHTGGLEEQQLYKSDCPQCWQALKATEGKEVNNERERP